MMVMMVVVMRIMTDTIVVVVIMENIYSIWRGDVMVAVTSRVLARGVNAVIMNKVVAIVIVVGVSYKTVISAVWL